MEGTPACIPHRTDPGRLFFRKSFVQMFIVWNIFSSPKPSNIIFLETLITRESYLRTRDVAPFTRETPLTDAFAWTHKLDNEKR